VSITVVGTIGIDSIYTPFGQAEKIIGGSASYFSLAASKFAPVNVVAVVGDDLPPHALDPFQTKTIDLAGITHESGPTFSWGGRYLLDFNTRESLFTELGVLATFNPIIPVTYRDVDVLFLANLTPTIQESVLKQTKAKLCALDTMNYWITGMREDLIRVLRQVDIVIMSEEEVRQFAGVGNLWRAARTIFDLGPNLLVIKLGSYGAILMDTSGGYFAAPGFPLDDVIDPTGAGDAFAGGFLGAIAATLERNGLLTSQDFNRALIYGNITGSFTCESFGVDRLAQLTVDDISQRYATLIQYTHIAS
jgi:sugar/nucleoside kinase (ribokinase family)